MSTYFHSPTVPAKPRRLLLCTAWLWLLLLGVPAMAAPEPEESWLDVVRQTPYWTSRSVADNLATIRRWVLLGDSYCSQSRRHLLFDRQGRFLAYIDDADTPEKTVARLNETRQRMAGEQQVAHWSRGTLNKRGYPFALACHQPFVDIQEAIARLTGSSEQYRLWGTWDGISVGGPDNQVSLVELFRAVYEHRSAQGRFSFPDNVMPRFLGMTIIESGGQKQALSRQAARGIMQLRPEVLDDCEVPEAYRLHRMAQVDCALRLMEQNHRNLQEPFNAVFGDLPADKRQQLYGFLLLQSYQLGVGRTIELLKGEELGRAARYFASNHEDFSAEDIQMGLIYHNMGRRDIGLSTLYYVTDARIAREALCASPVMAGDAWCNL